MKSQSCKAKGRRFQQETRDAFLEASPSLEQDDIRSNPMGAQGEDLLFSPAARKIYPFSVECKNVEKLNIWEAISQAKYNSGTHTPLVAFKKNGHEAFVAVPMSVFLRMWNEKATTGS